MNNGNGIIKQIGGKRLIMVHFDFVVTDGDAELIMGCMHNMICHDHEMIMKEMVKKRSDMDEIIKMYRREILYLEEELIPKMKNTRILKEDDK